MPNSKIKIAYTMIETTQIPNEWTSIINNHFDAIVVPDTNLIDVYKNSGVRKPIFAIPHPIYIDEFLAHPLKTRPNDEFVFGIACVLSNNKNCELLVDAFINEFGNTPNVKLKIQSPWNNDVAAKIRKKIKSRHIKNIEMHLKSVPWKEYISFMKTLDCYVLVSKGEGFSVTPREALALGIPAIISNNTAHKTICQTGYVYGVPSDILEKHTGEFYGSSCGYCYNCKIEDVQKALREVYSNYNLYLEKAHQGREWVKQYRGENLKKRYINLFKPETLLLGNNNIVTDDYVMTTDNSLYLKYLSMKDEKY